MSTTEKRPRIKPEITKRIDKHRGRMSFERFVNTALKDATRPAAWTERDGRKGYLVVMDEEISAEPMPLADAANYAEALNCFARAIEALTVSSAIGDAEGMTVIYNWSESILMDLTDAYSAISEAAGMVDKPED